MRAPVSASQGSGRPEGLSHLHARAHPVLVKAISGPGAGKPGMRTSLNAVQLLLRLQRRRREYRVFVFEFGGDGLFARLAQGDSG